MTADEQTLKALTTDEKLDKILIALQQQGAILTEHTTMLVELRSRVSVQQQTTKSQGTEIGLLDARVTKIEKELDYSKMTSIPGLDPDLMGGS